MLEAIVIILFGLAAIVFVRIAWYIVISILKLPFDKRFWY